MTQKSRTYLDAHAALRIMGDDLDPSEVTRVLHLPPDHQHRTGDLRISRSKTGKVLEYAPYRAGMWSMDSEKWVEPTPKLEPHLKWILEQVEPRAELIMQILSEEGVTAGVFCYSFGRTARVPAVPKLLRSRFAALGLEVLIDHYS